MTTETKAKIVPCNQYDHDWTVEDGESGKCAKCGVFEHWPEIVGILQEKIEILERRVRELESDPT